MGQPELVRRGSRLDLDWVRERGVPLVLALTFGFVTLARLAGAIQFDTLGVDARIYRLGAAAILSGQDPWAQQDLFRFAGTPPSLVLFLPAAFLPEIVTVVVYGAAFAVVGFFVLRQLELPVWWILFPPLAESILTVNQDVVILWLLLMASTWAGLAVVCKTYAVVPLALQGRWRPVAVGMFLSVTTLPLWITFLQRRDEITRLLTEQADGGLSAWGTWWLFIPTVIALYGLRGRGASWLVIPAVWPATQLHYSLLALPVARRSPVLAFMLCFANPLLPAVAVILECLRVRVLPEALTWLRERAHPD